MVEQCWVLLGERRGRVWYCHSHNEISGERTFVQFDGPWVLEREESHGDVVGFLHTHPDGPAMPSQRDVRTMRAWCLSFGKPLVCLIDCPTGLLDFRFENDESIGEPLEIVEAFPHDVLIGVDALGGTPQ